MKKVLVTLIALPCLHLHWLMQPKVFMFKLMLVILLLRLKTTLVKRNSLIKQKALALVYLLVMILVTSRVAADHTHHKPIERGEYEG